MRICLAIESSSTYLGVAFHAFDQKKKTSRPLLTDYGVAESRQSDLLMPRIDKHFKRLGLKRLDLGLIAVDVGPGSFTGVRVGVSTARALAQGLNIPCIGINSLEALAVQSGRQFTAPFIPAQKNEAYFAVYKKAKPVVKPSWGTIETYEGLLRKYKNQGIQKVEGVPHPDAIASWALVKFFKNPASRQWTYGRVAPLYLQPSWAERK